MNVTVWNEHLDPPSDAVRRVYPSGTGEVIAEALRLELGADAIVRTATLKQPEHGLTSSVLDSTDVLTWWGHKAHEKVSDEVAAKVQRRVLEGMGLVVLHSGHHSKPFRRLMGTSCNLRWREDEREVVWTVAPSHPIASDIPPAFVIPVQEMYGEFFDVPPPDELVFVSSFSGGEVFRSGCCWSRGKGRIFYFSPGHETYPVYHQSEVRRVIANGVRWARGAHTSLVDTSVSPQAPRGWFES